MSGHRDLSFTAFLPQTEYRYFESLDWSELNRPGDIYNPTMAWLLSELSMLAYIRDMDFVRATVAGLDPSATVHPIFGPAVHGFVVNSEQHAFLVFRGTESAEPETIITDLRFQLVPDEHGYTHQGFKEAWAGVAPRVIEHYSADKRLWVTGHSLGGALAVFAGNDLPAQAVYTFGAPRVGTTAFRDRYPVPTWRVANNNDLVPMLPPPVLYRHVGEARYIDHQGTITAEESQWTRAQSQFQGHREHASEVIRKWARGQFNALPSANLSDHAPINYVGPLKAAALGDS